MRDFLKERAELMGHPLSPLQLEQLEAYGKLLVEWNEKMNLTAITEPLEIAEKHFLDSLSCIQSGLFHPGLRMIDVGTGAGFPGMVLHICVEGLETVLLDSLGKRITFLDEVIRALGLTNITAVHARAEDGAQDKAYREGFDLAVSRAVADMAVLSEYTLPYVKTGGFWLSQKGPKVEDEVSGAKKAIEVLGGELVEVKKAEIPMSDLTHSLVVVKKVRQTPTKYPRKAGKPSKEPIK